MRTRLGQILAKEFSKDSGLHLFVGDIGYRIFDDLRKETPAQFHNMGIAEQHMVSYAAGFADAGGGISFVYTISPFLCSRANEQIRVDVAYPKAPVVLITVGKDKSYKHLGFTHYGIEDLSLIGCYPNMNIFTPETPDDVEQMLSKIIAERITPAYVRLGL